MLSPPTSKRILDQLAPQRFNNYTPLTIQTQILIEIKGQDYPHQSQSMKALSTNKSRKKIIASTTTMTMTLRTTSN